MTDKDMNNYDPDEYDLLEIDEESEVVETLDEGKRRFLLMIQLILIFGIGIISYFAIRYFFSPQPISQMLPVLEIAVNNPPLYKFSFDLSEPGGVTVSPDNQRIYAIESSGDRLIKLFDRNGTYLTSFSPPYTNKSNRKLGFIGVGLDGRVFVSDIYNDVISIFDADGNFIDGIIGTNMTLSKLIYEKTGIRVVPGTIMYYDLINHSLYFQEPGKTKQTLSEIFLSEWSPLGVRFDQEGNLLITNFVAGKHTVIVYPSDALMGNLQEFSPNIIQFGKEGLGSGEFSFPNAVVKDSKGNYFVSDGNNGRISVWTAEHTYSRFFGLGSSDQSLNLPKGIWMDKEDRLFIADSVGQYVRVFDTSTSEPTFLYNIGEFGLEGGEFNFPADVFIDGTGRMYVADRKNNRVQVWSY
jgi:DNA-binding beta-propeller fold protein YncE